MVIDGEELDNQVPRHLWVPDYASSSGQEAVDLARSAGLNLDPWQQMVLMHGLAETPEFKWQMFEVCVIVSRQNGKGAIIEARELAGLFLFDERLIIHTAHLGDTSIMQFKRICQLIESNPDFERKVQKVSHSKGSEGVILKNGAELQFRSRSTGGGRGFTGDCVIMDECMILGQDPIAALVPTVTTLPNPQIWYLGSAGIGEKSEYLAQLRARGLLKNDPDLAFMEWSVDLHDDHCLPSCTEHMSMDDPRGWFLSNPGVPYRISMDYIRKERKSLGVIKFPQERLGVGNYPEVGVGASPITFEEWNELSDKESEPGPDIVFAVDVAEDRRSATIASYSVNENDVGHVELIEKNPGTEWVVERLAELKEKWNPLAIAIDRKGPGSSLLIDLKNADIYEPKPTDDVFRGDLLALTTTDMTEACGQLVDEVRRESFRHTGDEVLAAAIQAANIRPVGDQWVWTRKNSEGDIAPLVAVTMAQYAYQKRKSLLTDYDILMSAY